jgi:hypothetical protein
LSGSRDTNDSTSPTIPIKLKVTPIDLEMPLALTMLLKKIIIKRIKKINQKCPQFFFSVNFFKVPKKKKQPMINVTALCECQKMYIVAQKTAKKNSVPEML